MDSTFPSLSRKYSTFRNDLPFFVWQRYLTNASLPASGHALQIKSIDKVNLCIPALRFESALTDVVVAGRAREGKVVGHQGLKLTLVLFLPCLVPASDNFLVCRAPLRTCARPCGD